MYMYGALKMRRCHKAAQVKGRLTEAKGNLGTIDKHGLVTYLFVGLLPGFFLQFSRSFRSRTFVRICVTYETTRLCRCPIFM